MGGRRELGTTDVVECFPDFGVTCSGDRGKNWGALIGAKGWSSGELQSDGWRNLAVTRRAFPTRVSDSQSACTCNHSYFL